MFYAREEVLVCAGAVGTPWLLQRSGIGPAVRPLPMRARTSRCSPHRAAPQDVLQRAGVPVVAELPVGCGLRAQMRAPLVRCRARPR